MTSLVLIIVSSIFGAGFATGAELVTFFGNDNPLLVSVLVGLFLFGFMAALIFAGKHKLPMWLVRGISFVFLVAMIAATVNMAGFIVAMMSVIVCLIIINLGFESALRINKYIMGAALAVLFVVAVSNFEFHLGERLQVGNALLYAGMNSFLLVAIFAVARKKFTRQQLLIASIVASVCISVFVFVILSAVQPYSYAVMPILELNNSYIVWLAVFVSVFTSMYVAMLGVNVEDKHSWIYGVALVVSLLGFKKIIGLFYPIIGAAMILYVLVICVLKLNSVFRRIRERQGFR